jgi:hypothetical protein
MSNLSDCCIPLRPGVLAKVVVGDEPAGSRLTCDTGSFPVTS